MPHSLGKVYVHLVLPTADHVPFLKGDALRRDLHGYMMGIFRQLGCPSQQVGGTEDHVHALFRLSRVQTLSQVVREVQRGSALWLERRGLRSFGWHDEYGAFSVSPKNVDKAVGYIRKQPELHQKETFADEYRRILRICDGLRHKVDVHFVFSTKNRFPFLVDRGLRQDLHRRLEELCESVDCPASRVGGIEDHVHILYRLSPDRQLSRVARDVKKSSTSWLVGRYRLMGFSWQAGYAAFSVSPQHVAATIRYIENQEEHHRGESAADEFDRILGRRGIGEIVSKVQPPSPG